MKFKIKNDTLSSDVGVEKTNYPKYATQLINLANGTAQSTNARVVGQMSELIQEFPGRSYTEWVAWYEKSYPDAIENAVDKTMDMLSNYRKVLDNIDRPMVVKWTKDLVNTKTFTGLVFQESILKAVAKKYNKSYRLATPAEESKGIDGFIGDKPVSIKPESYKVKSYLPETIDVSMIFYKKVKDGITVIYDENES